MDIKTGMIIQRALEDFVRKNCNVVDETQVQNLVDEIIDRMINGEKYASKNN